MDSSPSGWAAAVLWLYSCFIVFWGLQWWLGRHIQGLALLIFGRPGPASGFYFYLLAPGVILHELSHWLVAKLLFVPTRNLVLFRPQPSQNKSGQAGPVTLGYVEIFKTDPLRQSFIGLAPLPAGILTLVLLAALLNFSTEISANVTSNDGMVQALLHIPLSVVSAFQYPVNILWLYLVFAVSNGMLPSRPDRRPWLIGFLLPGSILLVLTVTGLLPPFSPQIQQGLREFMGILTWIFGFAAFINFLLATLIFILESLVSRMRRRRVVYK